MQTTFPTPLEILINPVALVILAMFAGLALWEAMALSLIHISEPTRRH